MVGLPSGIMCQMVDLVAGIHMPSFWMMWNLFLGVFKDQELILTSFKVHLVMMVMMARLALAQWVE